MSERIRSLSEVIREHVLFVLRVMNGHRVRTARALGIGVRTLTTRLREYGVPPRAPGLPDQSNTESGTDAG